MPGMASKTHSVTVIAAVALAVNRLVASSGAYATSSNDVLGVSEIAVAAGRACSCITAYSWPVEAAEAIAEGDWVKPAADGSGRLAVGSDTDACGRAITAAAVGQLADVRLMLQFGVRGVGAGLTAAAIDALPAADGTQPVAMPASQGGGLAKVLMRPSLVLASWAALLALTDVQPNDLHYLAVGVLGNMRPVPVMRVGGEWVPMETAEWHHFGTEASPPTTPRTAAGLFALAVGGSTALATAPGNSLRIGSLIESEFIVRRYGSDTTGCNIWALVGTDLSTTTIRGGGDVMSGSANTEMWVRGRTRITGPNTAYTTWTTYPGGNQANIQEITNAAYIDLAVPLLVGVHAALVPANTTVALMDGTIKITF